MPQVAFKAILTIQIAIWIIKDSSIGISTTFNDSNCGLNQDAWICISNTFNDSNYDLKLQFTVQAVLMIQIAIWIIKDASIGISSTFSDSNRVSNH